MSPPRILCLVALLVASGCGSESGAARDASGPSVLLVTLDTTRVDHLGCYGYGRDTSPRLDALAQASIRYTSAYSTSSWTLPAHASLFTGKLTFSHGARYDPDGPLLLRDAIQGDDALGRYRARGLSPEEPTLAGMLRQAGFRTGAFVAGPWLKRIFGLDRGFDHYDDRGIDELNGRLAADVTDRAIAWIDALGGQRFFLFLNYYDPHGPYQPPEEYASVFLRKGMTRPEIDRALYDAEIRYMDEHLGRLLDHLRQQDLFDASWIIVTADHGELLGEHGPGRHGRNLWQQEIRVPLLVRAPGAKTGRVEERPAQLTDVLPMLLRELGIAHPHGAEAPGLPSPDRPVVAELYPPPVRARQGELRAFVKGHYKLIWSSRGRHRLFDLVRDPAELRSLAAREPERVQAMSAELEAYLAQLPRPGAAGPPQQVDDETRRALEQLGYLE